MDLPKLLDLLRFRALYLRRANGFVDRLEGALFPSHREFLNLAHAKGLKSDADEFYRRGRAGNYVSCWARGATDSMALWQLYGGAKTSVAITTTILGLVKAVLPWDRNVLVHRVKYIDHTRVKKYVVGHYTDMLQYKHKAYKYENEVRLIVPQQEDWENNPIAIRLPVLDMGQLVKGVIVGPEATPEFIEIVKDVCAKYGVIAQVRQSKLATAPV